MKISIVLLLLMFAVGAGCKQQKKSTPTQPGKVITTTAYENAFGSAPANDKGCAYAFVIYFPLAKEPAKVTPFPFFTFDEASIKKVAIERLLSGMDIGSYQGEFMAIPQGTRLIAITEDKGTLTVTLNKTSPSVSMAIAATVQQFKGVSAVQILEEGSQTPTKLMADERVVNPPGPPRLLNVAAMREKGTQGFEEVDAYFDRPVDIKELKLSAKDGQPLQGDLYHSVFDMAGVLKPKDQTQLKERMPIHVRWNVVDKLGRQAQGDDVLPLEVKEH